MKKNNLSARIFVLVLFLLVAGIFGVKKAEAAGDNCVCSEGSLIPFKYPVAASFTVQSDSLCKTSCMGVLNAKYYSYSNIANFGQRRIYNCLCVKGSAIPFYYPLDSKFDVGSDDECNQKCADNYTPYYSYSNLGNLGTSKVTKNPSNAAAAVSNVNPENLAMSSATANGVVPGSTEAGGLIQCGRGGQKMCTLCDVIVGINNLIKYMFRISIVVGIAAFTLGGVMYVLSVADSDLVTRGKLIMQYAAIGIVVMASAWLMVNYTMTLLGKKETMGITKISGWDNFSCTRRE